MYFYDAHILSGTSAYALNEVKCYLNLISCYAISIKTPPNTHYLTIRVCRSGKICRMILSPGKWGGGDWLWLK